MDIRMVSKNLSKYKYSLAVGILLVIASALSISLVTIHARLVGANRYPYLVWNLFLAWIPFMLSLVVYFARRNRVTIYWIMPVFVIGWFIYFPNTIYLQTDFQHLVRQVGNDAIWFEVVLLLWFAWTGLMLGVASLYLIQTVVTELFSPTFGWAFTIMATFISSVGVYLGRFLRFNSWDFFNDPLPILKDIYALVRHPEAHFPMVSFSVLYALLFLFVYMTIYLMARVIARPGPATIQKQ
jgi:uncharacterized membrane protein